MVLFHCPQSFLFPIFFYIVSCGPLSSNSNPDSSNGNAEKIASENDKVVDPRVGDSYKVFHALVSQIVTNQMTSTLKDIEGTKSVNGISKVVTSVIADAGREKVASAATTIVAMALANGLITTPTRIESLVSADANQIAAILSKHVAPETNSRLATKYKEHVAAGKNPVEALGLAMENFRKDKVSVDSVAKLFQTNQEFCANEHDPSSKWARGAPCRLKFNNQYRKYIRNWVSELAEYSSSVMENTTYNDVDQLIRLVRVLTLCMEELNTTNYANVSAIQFIKKLYGIFFKGENEIKSREIY